MEIQNQNAPHGVMLIFSHAMHHLLTAIDLSSTV